MILFNARLTAQEEQEREKRRLDKATKTKDDAAAKVRQLDSDPKATADQRAAAQSAYMSALDAWNRVKAGEPDATPSVDDEDNEEVDTTDTEHADDDVAPAAAEAPAVEESTLDEPPVEESAVDEPAVEESAVDEPPVEESAVDEPPVDESTVDEPPNGDAASVATVSN